MSENGEQFELKRKRFRLDSDGDLIEWEWTCTNTCLDAWSRTPSVTMLAPTQALVTCEHGIWLNPDRAKRLAQDDERATQEL